MSNLGKAFLATALVSLGVAIVGHSHAIVEGLGKAFFGVFLIGFFIDWFFGEPKASKH